MTMNGENGEIQLMQYSNGEFVYRDIDGHEHTLQPGTTIEVGIRESETRETKASNASNTFTITLKSPQTDVFISSDRVLLNSTETNRGTNENKNNADP